MTMKPGGVAPLVEPPSIANSIFVLYITEMEKKMYVRDMQIGRKYLVDGVFKILKEKKEHIHKLSFGQTEASYDLTFYDPNSGIQTVSPLVDSIEQYGIDPDYDESPTCCCSSGGKKTRRKMKKRKSRKSRKARKSARKSRR
jgi:hypothetical protein